MKKITGALVLHLAIIFLPLITFAQCGNLRDLPSIQFPGNNVSISKDAQVILESVATKIKNNPNCRVKVIGHGASNKGDQQISWDRVNSVISYLVEKQGIGQDRFIFSYGEEGDKHSVDLAGTIETGPESVPAPHPDMQRTTLPDAASQSGKTAKKMNSSKLKTKKNKT